MNYFGGFASVRLIVRFDNGDLGINKEIKNSPAHFVQICFKNLKPRSG